MAKIIRLTESDLVGLVKRIIKEDFDYNETINDFDEIIDDLISLAEKGEFILHVSSDRTKPEVYGKQLETPLPHKNDRDLFVRINHPTNLVISPSGYDNSFVRQVSALLYERYKYKFPELDFALDGYTMMLRPKKYVEQGLYGEYKKKKI